VTVRLIRAVLMIKLGRCVNEKNCIVILGKLVEIGEEGGPILGIESKRPSVAREFYSIL